MSRGPSLQGGSVKYSPRGAPLVAEAREWLRAGKAQNSGPSVLSGAEAASTGGGRTHRWLRTKIKSIFNQGLKVLMRLTPPRPFGRAFRPSQPAPSLHRAD